MAHFKKNSILTTSVLAMLAMSANLATAQEADVSAEQDETMRLETRVVTGYRSTLQQARDAKRVSNIIQDSIVAEDIAKFPDLNLAESLQRLPGVAINREAGEGRRVSLRGLGSSFTRVQLNGMEVLGNVDSPQDSRGQSSRDRAFDFNIFASELFSRIDVSKTLSAEQNEGGLAGTIGLYTAKPFDYDGFTLAASAQGGTNTATEDLQPRMAALISNNWGDFGALFSVAYSQRQTEEQGYNTYRWRPRSDQGSDISSLSQAEQEAITSGDLSFPRGNRYSVWASEQERLGITTALQWAPSETFELTLDALYGEFTGDRNELHIASRGSSSTWLGGGTTVDGVTYPNSTINAIEWDADNEVTFLDVSGGNIASETRRQQADNDFTQIVLTGEWNPTADLKISGLIGTEESNFEKPISDKFYLEQFNDVTSSYDGYSAFNVYGFDPTDASLWRAHEIDFEEVYQSSSFDNIKLDVEYALNEIFTVKGGLAFQKFKNDQSRARLNNLIRSELQDGTLDDDVTNIAVTYSEHDDVSWTIVDFDAALNQYNIVRDPSTFEDSIFSVGAEEETVAAYLQTDWNTEIGGLGFRGNAGLRYFETSVTAHDFDGELSSEGSYDDVLPAINATLEISENFLVRAAYSRNINRLPLGSLTPATYSVSVENDEITVSQSSDQSLSPYYADNFDFSAEWYFGDVGLLAAGVFHKKITDFPGTDTAANVSFGSTGADLEDLAAFSEVLNPSADTNVDLYTRPISFNETDLTGIELSAQTDFLFLPAPFDKLGFVGNYTYLDADFEYASVSEIAEGTSYEATFPGLSKDNFNATLYYETELWGARISANYRGDYVQNGRPTGNDQVGQGFEETTYVDFAAFYQLNDQIKLTLDAVNLTDEEERQYSDIEARRLYNVTQAGTTVFAGVSFQF